ncbi:MAG: transcriptional repressor [Planctomycetes bacterium]|nr:transcriptional repressor [Planctomycetota bacterium]
MAKTFRRTRQRESVRAVIEAATRPLRADEVLFLAREQVPELGLATVYRTLKLLVDEGELAEVKLRSGATRYEPVQREHDSFFLCDACSRAFPIEARLTNELALPDGFTMRRREVTLLGTCPTCSENQAHSG